MNHRALILRWYFPNLARNEVRIPNSYFNILLIEDLKHNDLI